MKVLYITTIPSPYRIDFFNLLSKRCDLTVAFEMKQAKNRDPSWKGEELQFDSIFLKPILTMKETALCRGVCALIDKFSDGIVVIDGYSTPTGMMAIAYLRLKRIKFVISCDGGFIKQDNILKYLFKKNIIGSADYWLSAGNVSVSYLCHYGAMRNNIGVYHFSSMKDDEILHACDHSEKRRMRELYGIHEKKVILYVGSFIERKGVDVLLSATGELEDTVLVLVGGDSLEQYRDCMDKSRKCRILTLGFKQKNEMKEIFRLSDILVLPTREDIWGLVINEAMSYGVPVVTTRMCNAGLELIEDGKTGYIVSCDDIHDLSVGIEAAFLNMVDKKEVQDKIFLKIKDYSIDRMVDDHMTFFERIQHEIGL